MKSKVSYFNISGTLIRENMRRFWPIPVVGFLVYFLSSVFPILMNYKHLDNMAFYIEGSLSNQQPFFMVAHLILPIISAVLVFRYLQSNSSVSVIHGMPFTRPTLFFSNFLSGLLLSMSPVLLNGLLLFLVAKPVYNNDYMYDAITDTNILSNINVFSRLAVCTWVAETFIIILFLFAVAVFAGIVSGTGLMHSFLALGFNFLIPLLYITLLSYFEEYLYGFTYAGFSTDLGLKLSPYLHVFEEGGSFSAISIVGYLVVSVAIAALSLFLYQRRKLEKATDSLVFPFMEPIICCLITFFSMTLFSMYFFMLEETTLYRTCGYMAGIFVGFLIGQMIVKKTFRVFNRSSLKHLGIYLVIMVLFFTGLIFDTTGYERRIPKEEDIVSVEFMPYDYLPGAQYLNTVDDESRDIYKTPENVNLIRTFHKQLVAQKQVFTSATENQRYDMISLSYTLKNGSTLSRSYAVPALAFFSDKTLAPLFESAEYRKTPILDTIEQNQFNYLNLGGNPNVDPGTSFGSYATISDKAHIYALAKAVTKDILASTYEELLVDAVPLATLDFGYNPGNGKSENRGNAVSNNTAPTRTSTELVGMPRAIGTSINVRLLPHYKNTIAWLVQNGYEAYTLPASNAAAFMVVSHSTVEGSGTASSSIYEADMLSETGFIAEIPSSNKDRLVVTDRKKMNEWFGYCVNNYLDYNDYYSIVLFKDTQDGYSELTTYQMDSSNVPDEIRAYFQ